MTRYQSDLESFSIEAEDFASELTETIRSAAENADSEDDFAQQIRSGLGRVMDEFSLKFDYVDTQIGNLDSDEVKMALSNQEISIDDMPFDESDISEGGQRPDAVAGASVIDYKDPGILDTTSSRRSALAQLAGYMITLADVQNVDLTDTVGVVTDGEYFIFLHGGNMSQPECRPVNEQSTR